MGDKADAGDAPAGRAHRVRAEDMTPARWQEVKAALAVASELDTDARGLYLSELAAKDRSLSEEVLSLLARRSRPDHAQSARD